MQCVSKIDYYNGKNDTNGNSGFDLYLPQDTTFPAGKVTFVDFGIAAKTIDGSGFWVLPRSSLSKTPLRLANSMGLIDPSYRGNIIGALHNTSDTDYVVEKGTRLLQICIPVLMPFTVKWVDKLDDTERGSGGFGSTGK
jgi:dUTP pyrophosphatase